jgi:S1-C subfamily serine protease
MTMRARRQTAADTSDIGAPGAKTVEGKDLSPLFDGALFTNSGSEAREKGAQVATVAAASKAAMSGLRADDVIVSVNRKRIIGVEELASEVAKSPTRLTLNLLRGGQPVLLNMREDKVSADQDGALGALP